jgi:hypothetical protein
VIERRRKRVGIAAVAHIHADDIEPGRPCARGNTLNIPGVGRALEAMNEHCGEPGSRVGLPVAMAENAAAVGGVDFYRLRDCGQGEWGARQEIADDGLKVAIGEAAQRHKRSQPRALVARAADDPIIFRNLRSCPNESIELYLPQCRNCFAELGALKHIWDFDAQGCGKVVLMFLLLSDDHAKFLGERIVT